MPLSPVSLPQAHSAATPLCSCHISCQEQGFLKARWLSCSCKGRYFYPASASCLLAGGFCLLGLGLAISDKDWAFLVTSEPRSWPPNRICCQLSGSLAHAHISPPATTSCGSKTAISGSSACAGVETRAGGGQRGNRGISAAGSGKIHSYQTGTAKEVKQPGVLLLPEEGDQPAGF